MALRVHFTAEDLARTRMATAPWPALELEIALRILQERTYPVRFDAWRQNSFKRLSPSVRALFDLVPPTGWSVGFLTPAQSGGWEELLDQVRSTPRTRLREDVEQWADRRGGAVPAWTQQLHADPTALGRLSDVLAHFHQQAIAPYWPRISSLATADHASRSRQMTQGGVHTLLTELNPPRVRWEPPVLELTMASGHSGDIHLGGRGLVLVPSLFGAVFPALDEDAEPQPFMTYPIRHSEQLLFPSHAHTATALATVPRSLSALLGRTRAAVLCAIAEHPGCSTSELARHSGIAVSSASEHAAVLRATDFATSTRHRNAVSHALTPAGAALLNASSAQVG